MSRKQDIYIELLQLGLPHIRNVSSGSWWKRLRDRSAYHESELVHNLPSLLNDPDFGISDICFLNTQAFLYCKDCNPNLSPLYNHHVSLFRELFKLVPGQLRDELKWEGP